MTALVERLSIVYRRLTMNLPFQQEREQSAESSDLAGRLRALAHPVRLQILAALSENDTCHCGEIVRGLPLAQSTVSEHLRILREAGLIRTGNMRNGNNGSRACYCVDRAEVKKLVEEFVGALTPIVKQGRNRKARQG